MCGTRRHFRRETFDHVTTLILRACRGKRPTLFHHWIPVPRALLSQGLIVDSQTLAVGSTFNKRINFGTVISTEIYNTVPPLMFVSTKISRNNDQWIDRLVRP
ncbi:uncharacterized protein LOC143153703 [Ptiloglossa arizonensis]|uniref:uncharacterized protein LOC143153703 n=1 Tax=Ptiloglossa arizonensis TaxID=3350558 RepID=UPI003FA105BE